MPEGTNRSGTDAAVPSLITLLTDFGLTDPFVGVMKGVIASVAPSVRVIDLTHGIAAQDVRAAAFWLSLTYHYFPAGSVHVAVVDPTVGTERRALAVAYDGHWFLAPDNGLVGEFAIGDGARVYEIPPRTSASGNTFDGRDLFAPTAALLACGTLNMLELRSVSDVVQLEPLTLERRQGEWLGRVVLCDHFGNLITNIRVPAGAVVTAVEVAGHRLEWAVSYLDAHAALEKPRSLDSLPLVALKNAWGLVELACPRGSAARALPNYRDLSVRLRFTD